MERLEWYDSGIITRLTFVFTNGTRSPPAKSYSAEPITQFEVPKKTSIGQVRFGLDKSPYLVSIAMADKNGKDIVDLSGNLQRWPRECIKSVELEKHEHIVGAEVDVDDSRTEKV